MAATSYQRYNLNSNFNNTIDPNQLGGYQQPMPDLGINTQVASAPAGNVAATAAGSPFKSLFGDGGWFSGSSMFGGRDADGLRTMGWAPTALGVGQAIMGGIQGNKAMNLAQDQLKEGKRQFNLNYNAQKQTTNTQLEDRQRARVASNTGAYESVDSYMNKNKVV